MAYTPTTFTPFNWLNQEQSLTTPLNSTNIKALETRVTSYASGEVAKLNTNLEPRVTNLEGASGIPKIITVSGAYAISNSTDATIIESTGATTITVNASTNFPNGTTFTIVRKTTATVVFSPTSGNIVSPFGFFEITPQYGQVTMYKSSSNLWIIGGYLGS